MTQSEAGDGIAVMWQRISGSERGDSLKISLTDFSALANALKVKPSRLIQALDDAEIKVSKK